MSAVAGRGVAGAAPWSHLREPVSVSVQPGVRCVVRWSISRQALIAGIGAARPGMALAIQARGPDPILEWQVSPRGASAVLADGEQRAIIFQSAPNTPESQSVRGAADASGPRGGEVAITTVEQLIHVSVSSGGALVFLAVLRRGQGLPVLYARTSLFAEFQIGGGRYEILDGAVTDA